MVITVLPQKIDEIKEDKTPEYPFIKHKNILNYLNTIIEWPWCEFPRLCTVNSETNEKEEVELRNFLGDVPKLSPGNCFLYKGQVIAIGNKDTLILLNSETGPLALKRILKTNILPEIELYYEIPDVEDLEWEEVGELDAKINSDSVVTPPFDYYVIWNDYFINGRFDKDKEIFIKIEVSDEDFIFPVTLFFSSAHRVYVNKKHFIDDDHVNSTVKKIISWFINNESRKRSYLDDEREKAKENDNSGS